MMIRLDKYITDLGDMSRNDARELIRSGRVSVDGVVAARPDYKLEEQTATVCVDGVPAEHKGFRYYMMDKPAGLLTATKDRATRTVLDLLPARLRRQGLFPVGRLDKDTTGLLILTNDGEYAHRVISPKSEVNKLYAAKTLSSLSEADVREFSRGLVLADGLRCLPASLVIAGQCECLVTVREGKYHQVKRMLASRGAKVTALRRLSVGSLQIDEKLGAGGFREMSESEKELVFKNDCQIF